MRLGPLSIAWRTRQRLRLELERDQRTRELIARVARSEVKNYLAELAEQQQVPFIPPKASQ